MYCRIVLHKKPLKHKGYVEFRFTAGEGALTWTQNLQYTGDLFGLFTPQHFANAASTSVDPRFSWPDNIFEMNPNQKLTGGNVISNQVTINSYANLHKVVGDIHLMNCRQSQVEGTVYWLVAKQNTVRTPNEEWNFQLAQQRLSQSYASLVSTPGHGTKGAYVNSTFHGAGPMDVPGFKGVYECVKKNSFVLQGFSQIKIQCDLIFNKVVSRNRVVSLTANVDGSGSDALPPKAYKGATLYAMVVLKSGAVTSGKDNGDYPAYAGGKVAWVMDMNATISWADIESNSNYQRIYPYLGYGNINDEYLGTVTDASQKVITL